MGNRVVNDLLGVHRRFKHAVDQNVARIVSVTEANTAKAVFTGAAKFNVHFVGLGHIRKVFFPELVETRLQIGIVAHLSNFNFQLESWCSCPLRQEA